MSQIARYVVLVSRALPCKCAHYDVSGIIIRKGRNLGVWLRNGRHKRSTGTILIGCRANARIINRLQSTKRVIRLNHGMPLGIRRLHQESGQIGLRHRVGASGQRCRHNLRAEGAI